MKAKKKQKQIAVAYIAKRKPLKTNGSAEGKRIVAEVMREVNKRVKAYRETTIEVNFAEYMGIVLPYVTKKERHRDGLIQIAKKSALGKQVTYFELNDFLRTLSHEAWDRPSALYEVAEILKFDAIEADMHCPNNIETELKVGYPNEDLRKSRDCIMREIDQLDKLFKGNIPPMLLTGEWDT